MKRLTLTTILLICCLYSMGQIKIGQVKKPKFPDSTHGLLELTKRKYYFEIGVVFKTKSGCRNKAQATVKLTHDISLADIKSIFQKWIGPDKIIDLHVFYLKQIEKGGMYVFNEPYHCDGTSNLADTSTRDFKILNSKLN